MKKTKKPDYDLKAQILSEPHLLKDFMDYVNFRRETWRRSQIVFDDNNQPLFIEDKIVHQGKWSSDMYFSALDYFSENPLTPEFEKLRKSFIKRRNIAKSRISSMLSRGKCVFLTFTFTDESLQKTSADTRRQAVRRYLSKYTSDFVANIDFGSKNGREHYHAVALLGSDNIPFSLWQKKYGAINFEYIRETSSEVALSTYISKLCNHSIKETTKRSVLIYPRG